MSLWIFYVVRSFIPGVRGQRRGAKTGAGSQYEITLLGSKLITRTECLNPQTYSGPRNYLKKVRPEGERTYWLFPFASVKVRRTVMLDIILTVSSTHQLVCSWLGLSNSCPNPKDWEHDLVEESLASTHKTQSQLQSCTCALM